MSATLQNALLLLLDVVWLPLAVCLILGVTFAIGWWWEGRS